MKSFPWIVALVFATTSIVLLIMQTCSTPDTGVAPAIEYKIQEVKGDPIPYAVPIPKPYPSYKDTGSVHWRSFPIDTAAILTEHFCRNYYRDTLKNDTSALIVVVDTVSWNALQGRGLVFQNRRATIVYMPAAVPAPNRLKIYAGATVGRKPNQFGFGPAVMMITPGEHAYQLTYDVINKDVYLTALWKIGFRRKVP